jgi:hypothetical protein
MLKKARQSQKTNTELRRCDRDSAAQNDGPGNEAGTVMCQSFVIVKPLLEFD